MDHTMRVEALTRALTAAQQYHTENVILMGVKSNEAESMRKLMADALASSEGRSPAERYSRLLEAVRNVKAFYERYWNPIWKEDPRYTRVLAIHTAVASAAALES